MRIGPKLLLERKIFDINENIICQGSQFQWTEWLSEERVEGNDLELLSNYQQYHKYVLYLNHYLFTIIKRMLFSFAHSSQRKSVKN